MINRIKNSQRLISNRIKLLKSKSLSYKNDLQDNSIQLESLMSKINISRNEVLNLKNATVSYDAELDRVIFTIISKSHRLGKIEVEIERNSHEDREFRRMLLGKGLISDEESAALPVRRIIPKFLSTEDMPDPLYDDEFTLGQGERGKEVVWQSSLYPHMFIVGAMGTGKTNLTRNILAYVCHKTSAHVYEIDLSIDDPNPQTLYRNMSRGCKTTIDDALEAITLFHSKMSNYYENGGNDHRNEILLIENLDLVLPAVWVRPDDAADVNLEKKKQIQKMLEEIIEFGDLVKNMHLVCTTSARSFDRLLPVKDKEQVCYVSLGHISPEDSHYMFNDNGGYFVSPYIKGRGYIRFGTKSGAEFQSYLIEDDYLNHIAYVQQLALHR